MIRYNREELRDRIYACWVGKNIGGTMGYPYEGAQQINDIQGFTSPEGTALPNDDLDLQLVWLRAMDEQGVEKIDSKVLGQYWLNYIGPHWNEYGVCKCNMRAGILPPMSGSVDNGLWMNSNGAWIRTEIWACTHPGEIEGAIRLAFEDASVDHGFGEGSYAAIFVAAMESAAFVIHNINELIDIALSKIPSDCRVARSVKIVRQAYEDGICWKDARNAVVEDSKDLGWFQAPANVAFTILGLLYGEGDFKKSMILAINCGDDTDCTGATLGALMGIMYGSSIIPKDWSAYIGDGIATVAIIRGTGYFPASCTELTNAVMHLIPVTTRTPLPDLAKYGPRFQIVEEESCFGDLDAKSLMGDDFVRNTFQRSPYSQQAENVIYYAVAEFDKEPRLQAGEEIGLKISVRMKNITWSPEQFNLRFFLPEGFTIEGRRNVYAASYGMIKRSAHDYDRGSTNLTLKAGESLAPNNRIVCEISSASQIIPTYLVLNILG